MITNNTRYNPILRMMYEGTNGVELNPPNWKRDKFLYGSPCKNGFQLDNGVVFVGGLS